MFKTKNHGKFKVYRSISIFIHLLKNKKINKCIVEEISISYFMDASFVEHDSIRVFNTSNSKESVFIEFNRNLLLAQIISFDSKIMTTIC